MSKIKKLPLNEAKKIAAGEVVERPSNILKELIENSIDAQAKSISVYIKDGGKKLIHLIDDGCGMSKEDAILCFEHHATSKIKTIDDLDKIYTYGFRGEALSSISSISKVKLITKEALANLGTKLILEDGVIKKEESVSANVGTDIYIEEIFYNVPARLKFLKKSETEWRIISQLFQSYCFAYKDIHFKLFHDDNLVFNCPAVQDLKDRIVQVWNLQLSENVLPISYADDKLGFSIEGYISNHQINQFNKNRIYSFVNNRWIRNFEISKALLMGYQNVLPFGRFPVAIISIKVNPADVDINVHPRKEEVRLLHSSKIEKAIQFSVKKALEENLSKQLNRKINILPAQVLPFEQSLQLYASDFDNENESFGSALDKQFFSAAKQSDFKKDNLLKVEQPFTPEFNLSQDKLNDYEMEELFGGPPKKIETLQLSQVSIEKVKSEQVKFLGQVKNTYLLIENADGLLVIDQHAAHESVLFDLFSKQFDYLATVKLVFPHVINLQESEINGLIPQLSLLKKYGIEAERFGANQIIIVATPVHLKDVSLDDLVMEIISWLHEFENLDSEKLEIELSRKLCAQMACKASIKAGDSVTKEQVEQLIKDLYKVENRFTCPHGRPTFWSLSTGDIEKRFKRDYKT